jgi:hypothetical protein
MFYQPALKTGAPPSIVNAGKATDLVRYVSHFMNLEPSE